MIIQCAAFLPCPNPQDMFNELRDQERQMKGTNMSPYHAMQSVINRARVRDTEEQEDEEVNCKCKIPTIVPSGHIEDSGVPSGWCDAQYMFYPGSHTPDKGLQLERLQRGRGNAGKGTSWRVAGSLSNFRSIAATVICAWLAPCPFPVLC